jgi:CRP-like cAMP-binding protein
MFSGLSDAALAEIRQAAVTRRVAKDGFFFYQDDPAEALFVLSAGRVKLAQVTADGQQVVMLVIGPWTAFGHTAAFEDQRYPVSAQAMEDSEALAWPHETIVRLIEQYPRIAMNGMQVVTGRVQEFQNRYRELATERVERRVARAVLRLAQQLGQKTSEGVLIEMPFTRQDLAEMTGTTLYTVSRILSRWEEQELISTARGRILVKFPHGLVRIAEDLVSGSSE